MPEEGEAATPAQGIALLSGKLKSWSSEQGEHIASLVGQFGASIIVLIDIVTKHQTVVNYAYTVSVSSVAALFCLVGLSMQRFTPNTMERILFDAPILGATTPKALLSISLAVWWAFGTIIITDSGPFIHTRNGYFGLWLGFGCSVAGAAVSIPRLRQAAANNASNLLVLGVCAAVVIHVVASGAISPHLTPSHAFARLRTPSHACAAVVIHVVASGRLVDAMSAFALIVAVLTLSVVRSPRTSRLRTPSHAFARLRIARRRPHTLRGGSPRPALTHPSYNPPYCHVACVPQPQFSPHAMPLVITCNSRFDSFM